MQPFSDPSTGDRLNPRDIVGQLLVVRPLEYCTGIKTPYPNPRDPAGLSDAIRCDVVTLDLQNEDGTNIWRGVLWFQNRLITGLRPNIGKLILGWMDKGTGQPGQNQPFEIRSASGDQMAVARGQAWLAQHPEFMNPAAAPPQQQHQNFYGNQAPTGANPQQQSVLQRLQQQAQQPFPVTSAPPYQQGFQPQAPF